MEWNGISSRVLNCIEKMLDVSIDLFSLSINMVLLGFRLNVFRTFWNIHSNALFNTLVVDRDVIIIISSYNSSDCFF